MKKTAITVSIFIILFLLGPVALAQNPLDVQVDRVNLSTDETLALTVKINSDNTNPTPPTLPALEGFNIVGQSTSSQISIVNGVASATFTYRYNLQPTSSGTLTIPPISATIDGQPYNSEPLTIEVTQGASPTAPSETGGTDAPQELSGQDYFVDGVVDNLNPYLGQQMAYKFRFYQAVEIYGQIQYNAPNFTGFWHDREPDQTQTMSQAAGRPYRLTELNTVLFPTVVGLTTLEPATLVLPDRSLSTQPVEVDIRPLPEGAPDDFEGAVGQFTLTAQADKQETKVNEPITLFVILKGQGNINNIPDPVWPELLNWRLFESKSTVTAESTDGRLGGSRVYELLLVPSKQGDYSIPALSYSYFDPDLGQYQTAMTEPVPVTIMPGEKSAPLPAIGGKEEITRLGTDIRHIKPLPDKLVSITPSLTSRSVYWLAWLLPLALLGGNFAWQRRQSYLQNNIGLVRRSRAYKSAKKQITQIQQQPPANLYDTVEQVLTSYLSDKLGQPTSGLTEHALAELLTEHGVAEATINQATDCFAACHMGQFALGETDSVQMPILNQVSETIDQVEEALRK